MRILDNLDPPVNRGDAWPWAELAGWDGARKFCEECVAFLDNLNLPRAA